MEDWAYLADVKYEVWCGGGRIDDICERQVERYRRAGLRPEQAAEIEIWYQGDD